MKKKTSSDKAPKKKGTKKMLSRAKLALKNEFDLEASWIISALLEKRLKNILEIVEHQKPGLFYTFDQNIRRMKHWRLTCGETPLADHFTIQMIDALRIWKNQRNEVMKDMLVRHITKNRLERLAHDGIRIVKEWNASTRALKLELKKRPA